MTKNSFLREITFNPIQDGPFLDCSWMGRLGVPPTYLLHISHNDETWYIYTLPKQDAKNT